jgi:ubiquinone/menaquinone biosynthesis C-methylase UbiE
MSSEPLIDQNPVLQSYYASLESRIGYRLLLGGTRHFGYYEPGTWWPFPVEQALRRMEDKLFDFLNLPAGATVLDAGCGYGHVAIHLASRNLNIRAIDVVDRHVARAQINVRSAGLEKAITVQRGDYHHLENIPTESLDGVYTMETLVHATDAKAVLAGFLRVLKPGGSLVLFEYAHITPQDAPETTKLFGQVNQYAAMPANAEFEPDTLASFVEEVGFADIKQSDFTENVKPMLRLFFVIAYIPYLIIKLFGLEQYFVNAVAAIVGYRYYDMHRYVTIRATKPTTGDEHPLEPKKIQ